jgi:predicted transcriptional regulator
MDLHHYTGCKPVAISAAITAMTESGLIERDGRRHYIITKPGKAVHGRHLAQRRKDMTNGR